MRKWLDEFGVPAGFASLVALAGALGYYLLKNEFDLVMTVLTALGVLLLVVFFYANSTSIRGRIGARQIRYGSNTVVMVAAFIAILVLGNLLAARNTQRWDLTAAKDFTLSDQSVKVLASLKDPVKITGFFSGQDGRQDQVESLLEAYAAKSNKISFEFIDPDLKPSEAMRYQIRDYGTLVFESGSRQQLTMGMEESDITSAILKLTSGEQKHVAFLTGHGERDINDFDRSGYSEIKKALEGDNYKVNAVNLTVSPTLTADTAVLIVAAPQQGLLDPEKDAIRQYLDNGGRLLLLGDPFEDADLNDVIAKWGVEVGKGVAIDRSMAPVNDPGGTLVIQQYRWSPITKDLRAMAILPLATDVKTKNPAPEGVMYTPLFEISSNGWVQMDQRVVKFNDGIDTKGPASLAVTVEQQGKPNNDGATAAPTNQPVMVVFGNSEFASNQGIRSGPANSDLFVNSVNWLAQSDQLISIRPKPPQMRQLTMTMAEGTFVLFSSVVLLPGLVVLAGIAVWWKRR